MGDQRGVAVVALGGYARRELCPASDIDLVVLHDGWGRTDLQGLVETLCYPLWDAHLSVGHAVRTPAEAVTDAGASIDAATAVLDRRLVAGDPGLVDALSARVHRWSKRRTPTLLRQLADADGVRHHHDGAHAGMLEPNLKNGAGGLRDIHSLRWAAGWLFDECGLDPLVAAGYLGADDRRRLGLANQTLLAARCALHQRFPSRGKGVDVLRLDQQDDVAAALRGGDAPELDGDALLRQVGLATRLVAHLHARSWELLLADVTRGRRRWRASGTLLDAGVRVDAGVVDVDPSVSLEDDPSVGLRAVALAASTGAHLSRRTATSLHRQLGSMRQLPWSEASRAALLTLLHAGSGAGEGLAEADHVGLLDAHLPQWQHIRGRPQRNPLHRFDLDTHGAQAVVELHALRRDESLERLWNRLECPDALVLGAWLHDVGKAWPGDHSVVGAGVVDGWLAAMGFEHSVRTRVSTLVRHHLLLPDVATRRDLSDPVVIADVARTVGDRETLDALYLLSLADSRATGPSAWSPWKDDLIATLHSRAAAALRGDAAVDEDVLAGARILGADAAALATLSASAPPRYFDIAGAQQVAVHASMLHAATMPAVDIRGGQVPSTIVVSVVAQDRPGLIADCAGALAACDLAVVQARAVTTAGGVALDWFIVTGEADGAATAAVVTGALDGTVDVAQRLDRPRRRGAPHPWIPQGAVRVTVRDERTLEIEARDRPGLLHALCQTLDTAGLAITTVRAATLGPAVFDVFEVSGSPFSGDLGDLRNQLVSAAERTY